MIALAWSIFGIVSNPIFKLIPGLSPRALTILAVCASLLFTVNYIYSKGVRAGKNKVIIEQEKTDERNLKKARKDHIRASRPGAAERLRKKYCRDC